MRRTGSVLTVTVLAALLAASVASADDIEVSASVDRTTVELNGRLGYTITVEGTMRSVPDPKLPELEPAFTVYSSGSSTNMSWVNGRMSSSKTWRFTLVPQSTGPFTIGPAEVEFGGSVYRTEPIEVEVVGSSPVRSDRPEEEREPTGAEPGGRDVFITTSVDKERAYVDEQITLSFRFYRRVALWDQPRYEAPEVTGFWVEDLPGEDRFTETIDGKRYEVIELQTALFGAASGTATIGPAKLAYRLEGEPFTFFSRPGRERLLETDPIEVEILPLPSEGRPEVFDGAVGSYGLSAALETNEVAALDPVTLTVTIQGTGNISTVPAPSLPELPDFRIYESGTSSSTSKEGGVVRGRKSFEYVLVPQAEGTRTIPALELAFFDPETGSYRTVRTEPLTLTATEPSEAADAGTGAVRSGITRVGRDIRYIREPDGVLEVAAAPVHRRPAFLWLQLIPAGAIVAAWMYRRRRDLFAADRGLERYVRAPGRARSELKEARRLVDAGDVSGLCTTLARVTVDFLADRLSIPARGMTMRELESALRRAGVSDDVTDCVRRLLSECDLGRFAAGSESVDARRLLTDAERCLALIERQSSRRRR
ncbi:MAG: hypothetical protein GF405_06120 [Candidatus Eisenbacteria bacterium]|nr:hypothetical protein [Candidatus Eisenbacteria bacterium]